MHRNSSYLLLSMIVLNGLIRKTMTFPKSHLNKVAINPSKNRLASIFLAIL